MWTNPPFEDMGAVLSKLLRDKAYSIVLMPDWDWKPWYQMGLTHARKVYYFSKGEEVFLREDGTSAGKLQWGLWALLFHWKYVAPPDRELPHRDAQGKFYQQTNASERRKERKKARWDEGEGARHGPSAH